MKENNLPSISSDKLDFNLSLGIFGTLLASSGDDDLTIEQAYNFFLKSAKNNGNFIYLTKNGQPNGFIIWTKLTILILNSLKERNKLTINDKIKLFDHYSDEGEPVIMYVISPFDERALIITSWLEKFDFNKSSCWYLSGIGAINSVEECLND